MTGRRAPHKIYRPHTVVDHKKHDTGATRRKMSIMCLLVFLAPLHHFNTPLLPHPHLSLSLSLSAAESNQQSGAINKCHVTAIGLGQCCWLQETQCDDPSTIAPQKDKRTERKTKNMNTECDVNWGNISERIETESESDRSKKKRRAIRWRLCS